MKFVATLTAFSIAVSSMALDLAVPPPAPAKLTDAVLAAARAKDPATIQKLVLESFAHQGSLDKGAVMEMLDGLVRSRELPAFTTLLDEMRKTNYGKDWQPSDPLLKDLVFTERTDFLEALLARRLDLGRLSAQAKSAPPKTAEWITRRIAEVGKVRADIDALVAAAAKGEIETMRTLLNAGVAIDGVSTDHWTPLTRAANKNQVAAVKLLLERGAQVDKPRHPGWDYTPLCLTRSVEIAEALKAAGVNVHAQLFKRDVSILTYICRWGGSDLVEWMLKQGLDPKMIGDNKENLLFDAGDARTAELLLAAGVDPNAVNEFDRTPLDGAMSGPIALRLIEGGARVGTDGSRISRMVGAFAAPGAIEVVIKAMGQLSPKHAQSALMTAAHRDSGEVVAVLLRNGADANKLGPLASGNELPLMTCAIFGSAKAAKVLLENGGDPNGGKEPGELLETAVHNGHTEVAKLLRAAGARGVSDLAFAVSIKDKAETKRLLQSAPAFAEQPAFWSKALSTAARYGDLDTVRAALEKGVPIAPGTEEEEDAITAAAFEGQHEVLVELLTHRPASASPNDLSEALWNAVWNSHPYDEQRPAEAFERAVKVLLDAGAPVTPLGGRGSLVSMAVFTRFPGGNPKVIELLIAAGADPNPESAPGNPTRLSDEIQDACKRGSAPFASTIEMFEKLSKVTIQR